MKRCATKKKIINRTTQIPRYIEPTTHHVGPFVSQHLFFVVDNLLEYKVFLEVFYYLFLTISKTLLHHNCGDARRQAAANGNKKHVA